jgi:uncharacterized protein (TIGR02246 family)
MPEHLLLSGRGSEAYAPATVSKEGSIMSRKDIEALEAQWIEAFNAGDAAGVARFYTENGRVLPPNNDVVQGRSAIDGFVKEFLQMKPTMSFSLFTVHESPDMCASVGRYDMELQPPGAGTQKDSGKFIEIWTRQPDGSWLIEDDIFNSNLPAPPA